MKSKTEQRFTAEIYKNSINFGVDVPALITSQLSPVKGYIKVKGAVNGFPFKKNLVPVKNSCYRLFENPPTLKGAKAKLEKKPILLSKRILMIMKKILRFQKC